MSARPCIRFWQSTWRAGKSCWALYLSESEGARYWLSVLTDLHHRGVRHILIACVDGLTGFPEAIASIYPQTEVQLCVIHQIRNSLKYVAAKNQRAFMADLKPGVPVTGPSDSRGCSG